jgi:cation diffusion facilitator family transporter
MNSLAPVRHQRDRGVAKTLWIVLGLNLLVAGTKLGVGWQIGALSLVADGLHSVLDASSNVVGLVGLSVAARPPDGGHPYGHRRFETLAAVVIGLLIGAGFLEVLRALLRGLTGDRTPPEVSWPAAAAVAATILVNVAISRYESRRGRELKSALLEADAQHTASDALAAGTVLVGFAGVAVGWGWADLVAAALVAGFIARTAWTVLRVNVGVLADEAQLDPVRVYEVAASVPGVAGAHKIRSRGASDYVHLDLHIHVDPEMPLREAHALTHKVNSALRRAFPEVHDVVIHTEPADGREKAASEFEL